MPWSLDARVNEDEDRGLDEALSDQGEEEMGRMRVARLKVWKIKWSLARKWLDKRNYVRTEFDSIRKCKWCEEQTSTWTPRKQADEWLQIFFIELTYRLHLAACLGCPGKPEAGRATARPSLLNSTGISGNRYGIDWVRQWLNREDPG